MGSAGADLGPAPARRPLRDRRLAAHDRAHPGPGAVELGVEIVTGSRVTALPEPPVIVATQLESAATLLGDPGLRGTSGRCVLLDLGLRRHAGDAFLVFDLDKAGFAVRSSGPDPSLAPADHSLVQASMPLRPAETRSPGCAGWKRGSTTPCPGGRTGSSGARAVADGRSGALDLPGSTWRDRPAVDRGDGVFLAGDMVAAPGHAVRDLDQQRAARRGRRHAARLPAHGRPGRQVRSRFTHSSRRRKPASASITWPVIGWPSGPTSQATTPAISAGVVQRRAGKAWATRRCRSGSA